MIGYVILNSITSPADMKFLYAAPFANNWHFQLEAASDATQIAGDASLRDLQDSEGHVRWIRLETFAPNS